MLLAHLTHDLRRLGKIIGNLDLRQSIDVREDPLPSLDASLALLLFGTSSRTVPFATGLGRQAAPPIGTPS